MPSDHKQQRPRTFREPHPREELAHKRPSALPDPHRAHPKPDKRKRPA